MTDDQDVTANGAAPWVMPRLNKLFRKGGMDFPNYYVSTGLCCPSRVITLRGQYCHNTKVFDNGEFNNSTYTSGGWEGFKDTGFEGETIATLLQSAGYETAFIGKYMNGYTGKRARPTPPGWDHWMGLLNDFSFYGPMFSKDGELVIEYDKTVYQTDAIRDWVLNYLEKKRDPSKPFFLMVTPYAPHAPATPAKRHKDLFPYATFPRNDSFNPSDGVQRQRPAWIKTMPKLSEEKITSMDKFYRKRLQSLQAVDEALESITEKLDNLGLTEETYFMYTSDNGMHFGDHRMPNGKRQAYDTDVKVPFLVRGPGIEKGSLSSDLVQSVDLGPTFIDLASSPGSTYPMDGKSILPLLTSNTPDMFKPGGFRWAALLELYSGSSNVGREYENTPGYYPNHNHMYPNTYQAVRVINGPSDWASDANLLYVEWCTGEQELYNSTVDPHQVHNLIAPVASITDGSESTATSNPEAYLPLVRKLSRLVSMVGNCRGSECYEFEAEMFEFSADDDALSLESIKSLIRNRLPCRNPEDFDNIEDNFNQRRRLWAYDLPVPEPFTYGFHFSDADEVGEDLLETWAYFSHYFN